jgi:hypothetical protein
MQMAILSTPRLDCKSMTMPGDSCILAGHARSADPMELTTDRIFQAIGNDLFAGVTSKPRLAGAIVCFS